MEVWQGHPECRSADFVDLGEELRYGWAHEDTDTRKLRASAQGGLELLDIRRESGRIVIFLGLKIELEAAGAADATDGGRIYHKAHAVRLRHADSVELAGERLAAGRTGPKIFQREENRPGVGTLTAAEQVEAANREGMADRRILA